MGRLVWIAEVVHFVIDHQECRPAIITDMQYPGAPYASMQVFMDGPIYPDGKPQRLVWVHKAPHSKVAAEGHWHTRDECSYLKAYAEEQNKPKPMISGGENESMDYSINHTNTITQQQSESTERPIPQSLGSKNTD